MIIIILLLMVGREGVVCESKMKMKATSMITMDIIMITASHWAVVHREPGWGSSLPVEVLLGADHTHQKSLPTSRILGPILVSYVYEERGTYWLFGLCAASLLATGILTLAAYR